MACSSKSESDALKSMVWARFGETKVVIVIVRKIKFIIAAFFLSFFPVCTETVSVLLLSSLPPLFICLTASILYMSYAVLTLQAL